MKKVLYRGLSLAPEDRYPAMGPLLDALSRDPTRSRRRLARRALAIGAAVLGLSALGAAVPLVRYQRARICAGTEDRLRGVWDPARRGALATAFALTGKPYAAQAAERVQKSLDAYAQAWVQARTQACEATVVRREASDAELTRRAGCLDRRLRELETLASLLAQADARTVDNAAQAVEGLLPLGACLGTGGGAPPPDEASSRGELDGLRTELKRASVLYDTGRFDAVRQALDTALPEAGRLSDPSALAQAMRLQGQVDFEAGRLDAAASELQEAEWTAEGASDAESASEIAAALVTLAYRRNELPLAHLWAGHARALLRAAGGDPGLESDVAVREAFVYRAEAKLDLAESQAQRAYDLRLTRYGPSSARVANALMQLANIAAARGEEARALEAATRAASVFELAAGPDHPDTTTARGLSGAFLVGLGRCEEAKGLLNRALTAREAANPKHTFLALNHWDLGNLHRKMGEDAQAGAEYARALELMRQDFGPSHRYVGSLLADVARELVQAGHPDQALARANEAVAILGKSPSPDFGGVMAATSALGLAQNAGGHAEDARRTYALAVEEGRRLFGATDPRLAEPLTGEAEAELAGGHPGGALPLLEAALALRKDRPIDPAEDARTHFALARALAASGHEGEGRQAAKEALSRATQACSARIARFPDIVDWLASAGPAGGR